MVKASADKSNPDRPSKANANRVSQPATEQAVAFESQAEVQPFMDNRPEAIAQRKLQEVTNHSPQVERLAQMKLKFQNSPTDSLGRQVDKAEA